MYFEISSDLSLSCLYSSRKLVFVYFFLLQAEFTVLGFVVVGCVLFIISYGIFVVICFCFNLPNMSRKHYAVRLFLFLRDFMCVRAFFVARVPQVLL